MERFIGECADGVARVYAEEFNLGEASAGLLRAVYYDYQLFCLGDALGARLPDSGEQVAAFLERLYKARHGRAGTGDSGYQPYFTRADPAELLMTSVVKAVGDLGMRTNVAFILKTNGYADRLRDTMRQIVARAAPPEPGTAPPV